jgi:lysozyme
MPRVLAYVVAAAFVLLTVAAPSGVRAAEDRGPVPAAAPVPTTEPAADPAYVDGIDVSWHQGAIDWRRVAAAGKRFAFVRASAGTLTADTNYAANVAGARAAGLVVGSYHYANPDLKPDDAAHEAAWFLHNATVPSGDLVPVLDLEISNGLDPDSLTRWARTWLTQVTAATGVRPIIYTMPNFWSSYMGDTSWFADNGYQVLWIAHWTARDQPLVPSSSWSGNGWAFWQYSSTGSVPGIDGAVDLDRFNGSALPSSLLVPVPPSPADAGVVPQSEVARARSQ